MNPIYRKEVQADLDKWAAPPSCSPSAPDRLASDTKLREREQERRFGLQPQTGSVAVHAHFIAVNSLSATICKPTLDRPSPPPGLPLGIAR